MALISNRACSIPHSTTLPSCNGPSEYLKYSDGRSRLEWTTRGDSNGHGNEVFGLDDTTWLFKGGRLYKGLLLSICGVTSELASAASELRFRLLICDGIVEMEDAALISKPREVSALGKPSSYLRSISLVPLVAVDETFWEHFDGRWGTGIFLGL